MHHPAPLVVLPVLPAVYMMKVDLHPLLRPAHVTRVGSRVLIQAHFASLMAEVVMWGGEQLTDAERIALRLAFGTNTDLRVPVDDALLEGSVAETPFPACLELVESHVADRLPAAVNGFTAE